MPRLRGRLSSLAATAGGFWSTASLRASPFGRDGEPGPAGHTLRHAGPRRCAAKTSPTDDKIIGYRLVVGLNGTDDKLNDNIFTREALIGMAEGLND